MGSRGDVELVVGLEVAEGDMRSELVGKREFRRLCQRYSSCAEAMDAKVREAIP